MLSHIRKQVMDTPIFGIYPKTQTTSKNDLTSWRQNNNWLKKVFLKELKTTKKNVKIIYFENAGKNKALEEVCAEIFEGIDFESMSPGTPHKSGAIKWVFATLCPKICAIMTHAGLHENLKTVLWPNAWKP